MFEKWTSREAQRQVKLPRLLARILRGFLRKRMLLGLGASVSAWAAVEYAIDLCVDLCFFTHGFSVEPEVPRALNRKISYLRKVFKLPEYPDELRQAANTLLDRVELLSVQRHRIVHGFARQFHPEMFKHSVSKFVYGKTEMKTEEYEIHYFDLDDFTGDCANLADAIYEFAQTWLAVLRVNHLEPLVAARLASEQSRDNSLQTAPIPKA